MTDTTVEHTDTETKPAPAPASRRPEPRKQPEGKFAQVRQAKIKAKRARHRATIRRSNASG